MKEFWLAILKNVITYVVMIIIIVVGGITIMTQKFPPDWEQIRSAVTTLKNAYVSMINLRQSMSIPQGLPMAMPDAATMQAQLEAAADGASESVAKKPKGKAEIELETTVALLKSMSQQMQPTTPQSNDNSSDEELRKQMLILVKQNQDLIQRMDKIQTYLAGLNQYLVQIAPRQPVHVSAVQQPPPSRLPSSDQQPPAAVPTQNAKK